jgi:NTE family protein
MTSDASPKRVLVLQGGGALGSYQAGAYEGLYEVGFGPEWIAGISIGAINAAIIAGNAPEHRLDKLRAFWRQVSDGPQTDTFLTNSQARAWINETNALGTTILGSPGFFTPRVPPPMFYPPGAPEALSFYDTAPLRGTLERLVDFDRINAKETRLSVGAVNIRTGNFAYFDNWNQTIGPEHIMASGALPPGFPPIEIDGEAYWDGGLVSNTPLEYVLDEDSTDNLLIFQIDLFSARGPMPKTLSEAAEREKDIRYSSRTRHNTDANLKIHQAKLALRGFIAALPEDIRADPRTEELNRLMAENAVTIVHLIYRRRPYEGGSKDYEFSRSTMLDHWKSGVEAVHRLNPLRHQIMRPPHETGVQVFDVPASPGETEP